ncbi:MAG: GAF domain-containing protein, partial [Anaerolineae bacterium]|nr:GAF domain-containing protein [Anaerolineae bacterium]
MTTQSSPNIVQAPTTRFKGRLARRLLLILVPLSLVPIFLMGGTAYARARALLLEQTSNQITTFHDEQVSSFNNWVVTKEVRLDRLARKESFITNSAEIIRGRRFSTSYKEAEAAILSDLQSINLTAAQSIFNQYMLVSPNGDVILSTVPDWQGLNLNLVQAIGSLDLWSQKHTLALYSPEPLYSETFVIFSSQPIENQNGESIAAIVGISESLAIRSILIADLQFLPDSDAYFITADGTFVGIDKFTGELTSLAVNETQRQTLLNAGQSEELNIISFESFDQDLVIAGYSWLPFLNTGLIVEVPQASIYQQINSLAPFTLVLVALSAVGLALIVIIGTRGLVNPVIQVAEASRLFSEGDWQMRAAVNRNDEIGLLAHSFNHMADELSNLYRSLKFEVDERTRQVITASEVGQLATSAKSLNELMHTTVNLIVDRFGYYHAAIFLVDSAGEFAELREATGEAGHNLKSQGYRLSLDSQSIISWVINNNLPRIASDTLADEIYIAHELLPETHSEVGIPISLGGEILGVLDVQSTKTSAFDEESVNVLQTLSNQLATAIQNFRLLEGTEIDRQEITTLYRASRQISNASTDIEIFQTAVEAIQRSSYTSAIYIASRDHFKLVTAQDQSDEFYARFPKILHISNQAAKTYFPSTTPLVIEDIQKPNVSISTELLIMPQQLACQAAAFFPIMHANAITAIMILGSHDRGNVSQTRIQPYASLAELTATALEKVFALQESRSRIADLQILNELSNVITTESDINILYPSIYSHINKILGEVDFYIALYDAGSEHISFPFVHEAGENVQLDSIPLGEGLTSIVVRTRKPLLLVEDTEQKAISMGAKIIGQSAKSWLGIPLVIADKILGVMTVQDAEREHRFTENDMHLLSTLASQIAGAINNAQLLDESKRRALQLQTAAEIARDTSGTLEQSELLRKAINLIRERYDFYHASVFLMDSSREFAYVKESTGEAGRQMIANQHKLQVGSQSVIGTATATGQPLVVNDVTTDPTHRFNPLLP